MLATKFCVIVFTKLVYQPTLFFGTNLSSMAKTIDNRLIIQHGVYGVLGTQAHQKQCLIK